MPPAIDFGPQLSSHEDRLQRVEANSEETRVLVAEIGTKIDHYEQVHSRSRSDLSDKIQQGFDRINEDQGKLLDRLEAHAADLRDHKSRIEVTEKHMNEANSRVTARMDVLKKLAIGVLLAACGVLGTKLAETLVNP